jgi:hypothetical protein
VNKNKTLLPKDNYALKVAHQTKHSCLRADADYGQAIITWETKQQTEAS